MDNSMDTLDLAWTDEYFRTTEGGITYEPELMDKITVKIVYTNVQNEIFHTLDKEVKLHIDKNESLLYEKDLIKLIRNHRDFENKRYKCDIIVKYFISFLSFLCINWPTVINLAPSLPPGWKTLKFSAR